MSIVITRLAGKVQFADDAGNVNFAADFSDSIAPDPTNGYGVFFKRDNALYQGTGYWIDYRQVTTPDASILTRSEFMTLMCTSFFFKLDSGTAALDAITSDRTITKEPTGFLVPGNVVVTYNNTTKKVTLGGTTTAYWRGVLRPELIPGWESPALTDTYAVPNQAYYLYFDGVDYVWNTLPWSFDKIQLAYVYYRADGTYIFAIREPHGLMPESVHDEFHNTIGTYKVSGGTVSNYTLNSTTATNRRPTNDATVIKDEDVPTSHPARLGANFTHAYLTGANTIISDWNNAEIVKVSGNQPYYNRFDGANWVQQLMSNNNFMAIWVLSFPTTADADAQRYNFFFIQGQSEGTLVSQQALQPQNINLGALANISPEFVFINKIIIQYTAGNWQIVQVDNLLGNRFIQIGTPAGNYLSEVAVNAAQFSGNGTTGSPLNLINATNTTELAPVISRLATPPVTPTTGDRYLIIATATGAWIGKENQVAEWDGTAWVYTIPIANNVVYVTNVLLTYRFTGVAWVAYNGTAIIQNGNTLAAKMSIGTNDNFAFGLKTNNIERITTLANGDIGIGTSTPNAKFHVSDANTVAASLISSDTFLNSVQGLALGSSMVVASSINTLHRPVYKGVRSRGTLGIPTAVVAEDSVLSFLSAGFDGITTQATAQIDFIVDGIVSSGILPQRVGFFTSETDASARVERLTIKSNGYIGVGTTTPIVKLDVEGIVRSNLTQNYVQIGNAAGKTSEIATSNSIADVGTLIAGQRTITDVRILTSSIVLMTPSTTGTLTGVLKYALTNGQCVFSSTVGTDDVTFSYQIIF